MAFHSDRSIYNKYSKLYDMVDSLGYTKRDIGSIIGMNTIRVTKALRYPADHLTTNQMIILASLLGITFKELFFIVYSSRVEDVREWFEDE